jgi:hypothetical protein
MLQRLLLLAAATATCAVSAMEQTLSTRMQNVARKELFCHIDVANAQAFKHQANIILRQDIRTTYYVPNATAQDWIDCANLLLEHAQNKRNALVQEQDALHGKSYHYKPLLKATAQFYGALCAACSTGVAVSVFAADVLNDLFLSKNSKTVKSYRDRILDFNVALKKCTGNPIIVPALLIPRWVQSMSEYPRNFGPHPYKTTCWFLLALGASGYLTYQFATAGAKNLKIGLNYTKYLETQIKNLDDIIEFLHTQQSIRR